MSTHRSKFLTNETYFAADVSQIAVLDGNAIRYSTFALST